MTSPRASSPRPGRTLRDFDPRANGFDTIRLIAAILVIASHAFPLTGAPEPLEELSGGQASVGHLAVSVFFLISGFLIPASLDRGTLGRFAVKRALRIVPGLAAAVLLCAFVLGPLATTLAPGAYLTDAGTWRFVGNIAFLPVGYSLPGVFADRPMDAVNGSLWTLKFEVACYVLVPLLFALKVRRAGVVGAAWIASLVTAAIFPEDAGGALYYAARLAELFRFFGAGMLFYLLSDRIAMRRDCAVLATLACVAAVFTPFFVEVAATAGAYALIYFAYHAPPSFSAATRRGDISYGVYVYAFPIQQLLVPVSLALAAGSGAAWLVNFLAALPLALLAGLLSWLAVERPFLGLGYRRRVTATAAEGLSS